MSDCALQVYIIIIIIIIIIITITITIIIIIIIIRVVSGRTQFRSSGRCGSPFSSKLLIYGHRLVTLPWLTF